MRYDVAVIGGGPAGMAAALAAEQAGAQQILLIERDRKLGGILPQCIHNGFGLHRFQEELTGPEYAHMDIRRVEDSRHITCSMETFVTDLSPDEEGFRLQILRRGEIGGISAKAAVLAMGCRERTAGAISLPGTRPAGVFTAGTAQRLMNLQNITLGSRAVIIGSGDIGLIMARRLTLEGSHVAAVTEIMPYPGGLNRNVHQCLEDFDIPLLLSAQVLQVHGKHRVEGVTVSHHGRSEYIPCDTVLLSVGLIPENELTRKAGAALDPRTQGAVVDSHCMTSIDGLFSCGNVLHVHDVADYVSREAETAGRHAAQWSNTVTKQNIPVIPQKFIRYAVPQYLIPGEKAMLAFRLTEPKSGCRIVVKQGKKTLYSKGYVKLMPSEMVRIPVTPVSHDNLEVHCEQQ